MSSFLCFLCHSTVNVDTSDDIREKYRDIVGVHLCPDSQLCSVCCQVVNKQCQFKTLCLKRSMEYPVLLSEKLFMNLQRSETEVYTVCPEDSCKQTLYGFITKSNSYNFIHEDLYSNQDNIPINDGNSSCYVKLDDRESNMHSKATERDNEMVDFNHYTNFDENQEYDPHFNYTNNVYDEPSPVNQSDCQTKPQSVCQPQPVEDLNEMNENFDEFNKELKMEQLGNDCDNEYNDNTDDVEENDNFSDTESKFLDDTNGDESISKETSHNQSISDINNELIDTEIQNDVKITKNCKSKKHSKKHFEKIILTLKEQKTVLESQRKQRKYIEAEFKCYRCALGFRFKDTYQSHMMRHEESNGQFSCSVCGLRFATQNARCMHTILHSELYRCGICSASVKRTHRARHKTGCWGTDGQVACHMCARSFRDANCLQQHLKRFHEDKASRRTYSCSVCGKTYKEQSAVRNHMLKHINRRFPCEKCTKTFASPYTLNQHLKSHLPSSAPGAMFHCTVCSTSYSSLKSLRAHLKNSSTHCHDSLECQRCGRIFGNSRGLTRHLSRHETRDVRQAGDAPRRQRVTPPLGHLCDFCGKTYSTKSKLSRHLTEVCGRIKLEEEMTALYDEATNNL